MKKALVSLLLAAPLLLAAQTTSFRFTPPLSEGPPEVAGISAERLSRLDALMEKSVSDGDIPGAVVLIARNNRIVYHKAFGMADNAGGRKMQENDIFRIASQSKAITSTAVMMLWEEGKFGLDDPISRFIPEFAKPQVLDKFNKKDTTWTTVPAGKEITIRHLLTHTSGLGYGMIDGDERFRMMYQKAGVIDLFTTEDRTIGDNVRRLAKLPLHHVPGQGYTYSEGLDVLGYLIEVVSGQTFEQFLKTRLFEPLGMFDTGFYIPDGKSGRLVPVQYPKDGSWARYPVSFYDPDYPVSGARRFFSGGAGLCSTARDYAVFLQMYLNGGEYNGVRILSRSTIKAIMGNQFPELQKNPREHIGLAFGVVTDRGEAAGGVGSRGTFNWGGYFNTQFFADPQEQLIGIIMKQTQDVRTDRTGSQYKVLAEAAIDD